jgi:NADH:ubiquinone oxidoreductase subunit H
MAVILQITEAPTIPLTVDLTGYTVDSTSITVDQTVIVTGSSSNMYTILVTPREMVETVSMEFFNELKETTNIFTASTTNVNGLMEIEFNLNVVEGDSFQLTIKDTNDNVLWKGKAYATEQTDLQNFQFIEKNNNIIKI